MSMGSMDNRTIARLQEFLENHPDLLEDGEDYKLYLQQRLKLCRSYDKWQTMVCFVDFIKSLDETRDEAYQNLITDEKAREVRDGASFKSDAYLKGIIASTAFVKNFIQGRIEDLEEAVGLWEEEAQRDT